MNIKKVGIAAFFALIFSQLVSALSTSGLFAQGSVLETVLHYVFGISTAMAGTEMAIMFATWVIFFVAASDIIGIFTMFSTAISWIIGFALVVILANTSSIYAVAKSMFQFTATMGTFGIAAILIGGFVAAVLFHFGVTWAGLWLIRARIVRSSAKSREEILQGFRTARDVGHMETHRGPAS